jgi:hypothetical protein
MFYREIIEAFNQAKVKYVVVGGVAFNLLGGSRATADLDVLLAMDDENLKKTIKVLLKKGYKVKQPVDPLDFADKKIRDIWVRDKNLKAFNFYKDKSGYEELDIIVESPVSFEQARQDAVTVKAGGYKIPVIAIDKLISMKMAAGREQDILDVKELRMIKKVRHAK